MANYIGCRNCDPLYCDNCNIYILATMLREGKLDCLMDERHCITIDPASLRPKGEWITFGKRGIYGNMYACSECQSKYDGQSNFCPNCGADMRAGRVSRPYEEE